MGSDIAQLNISLPESMLRKLDEIVEGGDYASTSDFICDALRHEFERRQHLVQHHHVMIHLRELIDEGLTSGEPTEINDLNSWEETRTARLNERLSRSET